MIEPTPEERARTSITVADLCTRFLAEYAPPRIKDIAAYRKQARSRFNVFLPTLGKRAAASIRILDVERLRDAKLSGGMANNTVGNMLRALWRVYNWARKVGAIECANPVALVEKPRPVRALDYLSRDEVRRLLSHAAPPRRRCSR